MLLSVISLAIFVLVGGYMAAVRKVAPPKAALVGVLATLTAVLPHLGFVKSPTSFFPLFTVVLCAVYALFALGLNIVVGYAGLLDLGYVAFFLFGAYAGGWFMSDFLVNVNEDISVRVLSPASKLIPGVHLSFWMVFIIAGVIAAIAGVIIGAPTLRLKSDYLALVTLGFGELLYEVFRNGDDVFGINLTNGTKGIGPLDNIGSGPLNYIPGFDKILLVGASPAKYYIIVGICALFVWVSLKLRSGKLGRAWMAIREDELAASLMGVPLMKTKLWSYAIGAIAGGVGGAFYATIVGTVNVDNFTFSFSIIILCAVILGGMGNVWGVILGAVAITWVNYTGLTWVGEKLGVKPSSFWSPKKWEFALFGLVLVLMMLFRPDGFLPAARAKQVKKAEASTLAAQAGAA